jgi:putative transposase
MKTPFRYFNSSPEIIRLTVMMYIRYPHTSKKHGNCQADGGGQVSHTESIAEYVWDG